METIILVLAIGCLAGIINMLKSDIDNNNIRMWIRNILISGFAGYVIFYQFGYNPISIFSMSYFGDDIINRILEGVEKKEIV